MSYPIYNQQIYESDEILNIPNYNQTTPNYYLNNNPYYSDIDVSENIIQETKNNIKTFIANLKGDESTNSFKTLEDYHFRNSISNSNKKISFNRNDKFYNNTISNNFINKNNRVISNLIPINLNREFSPFNSNDDNLFNNRKSLNPLKNKLNLIDDFKVKSVPKNKYKTKLIKNKIFQRVNLMNNYYNGKN